jgi:acyl-CoA dehydrogenase
MENLPFYGALADSLPLWGLAALTALLVAVLGYTGASILVWTLGFAVVLYGAGAGTGWWIGLGVWTLLFVVPPVRQMVFSGVIMKLMKAFNFLPVISETEKTAIEAGTVWIEGELFSGKPDFDRILNETYPELTADEKAFLNGPVEELCRVTKDWDVFVNKDLPEAAWDIIKKEKFFGLIIPKEYGGLGFSALMNSAVVAKLASRCGPLATTVMVPNSLGPAELLIHYGTQAQKDHYLPNLATGKEIPAFALTEPNAGSDAGAITANGVVFRGKDGQLYIRLNWKKRYITLAAISTVLGLAFKLRDPENLLGKGEDLGITCALIPTSTEGVALGRRHDPLGIPFYNCPTEGRDVVVPIDAIIGGADGAGKGWRMLMESLAAGRGISLPASSTGAVKMVARATGAYATIRRQFGLSIGKFEGIEEPLARIGGYAYILEAARKFTCGALDKGAKPAVVTAIAKYNFTETMRKVINDGMDIMGGAAISRGPRNLLATGYMAVPISITVEGANILTRTLMIFGQGAIRCHPYAFKEIDALTRNDLKAFDDNFTSHIGHVVRNLFRSVLLSVTRGWLAGSPRSGAEAKYYRKMYWTSATFALLSDIALGAYGGDLKRREKLTGRFADILSWMYLGTSVLRRYEAEGRRKEDKPLLDWAMRHTFHTIQQAFDGIFAELEVPGLTWLFHGPVAAWSRFNPISGAPKDDDGHKVAKILQTPGEQRDRLTDGIYLPEDRNEAMERYERTFRLVYESDEIGRRLRAAIKKGTIKQNKVEVMVKDAVAAGVLTEREATILKEAEIAREDAIAVDEFTLEEYKYKTPTPAKHKSAGEAVM